MYSTSTTLLVIASLFATVKAFSCPSYISDYGFRPVCCLAINGQVGVGCECSLVPRGARANLDSGIPANQMGAENPTWECNAAVYNNEGCCQSIVRVATVPD